MPCLGSTDSLQVKEQFHLGTHFDPIVSDRRVTGACSYEVLLSCMGVWWSKIEKARRAQMSEIQEEGPLLSTDVWILMKVSVWLENL